jgi:hypothetical protein
LRARLEVAEGALRIASAALQVAEIEVGLCHVWLQRQRLMQQSLRLRTFSKSHRYGKTNFR